MRRRDFIALMGGAMIWWPLVAQANQPGKVWRIGYLSGRSGRSDTSYSFVQGLRELGYVEGENLIVDIGLQWEKTSGCLSLRQTLSAREWTSLRRKERPQQKLQYKPQGQSPSSSGPLKIPSRRGSLPAWPAPVGT